MRGRSSTRVGCVIGRGGGEMSGGISNTYGWVCDLRWEGMGESLYMDWICELRREGGSEICEIL